MAVDRKIKGMDVKYYPDARHRLSWYREKVPAPYGDYWSVFYEGKHVADVFWGKSRPYGVVFDRCILSGGDMYKIGLHIAGLFVNPGN